MQRWLILVSLVVAIWIAAAPALLAAEGAKSWPALEGLFERGSGAYLSPWKIIGSVLLVVAWAYSTDWLSQDAQRNKLNFTLWNAVAFLPFLLAFLLLWILPWFSVGAVLVSIAYLAPLISYVVIRNGQVHPGDKVMTPPHLKRVLAGVLRKVGIKIQSESIDPRDMGPQIKLAPIGGDERINNVNLLTARQSPGWSPTKELLDEALLQRATHIMFDFSQSGVAVRYQIDGVWHDRAPMDREAGDAILAVLKGLAGLKIEDRRSRQAGSIAMDVDKEKFTCKITSQGTQAGERALVQLEPKRLLFKSMEELGMRAKMLEQLDALVAVPGLVVFSALPGGGLSSTVDVLITHTDRFLRAFVAVGEVTKPEHDIENLHVTTYAAASGETPATVLPKLLRTYPDVVLVREVADLATLSLLCEQPGEKRTALTTVRAKEAVEALLRLLMLKVPPQELASAATAVLNIRLVRKLCDQCKEAYAPGAEVLKQLGLPAGRVESLYRVPAQHVDSKGREIVCEQCQGTGYYGRTGIFELLTVDDDLRQVLVSAPKLENLRATARKSKHRSLQEEGVLLVARGVTSLQELLRVLKQ